MNKINDPRDGRRKLIMLDSMGILGHDCTVWADYSGKISVYYSTDAPRSENWAHDLTINNYRDHMPEWAAHRTDYSLAASALGSIKSDRKAASSRENGKMGGRPTEKKTYWILSGEGETGTWEKHVATLTGIKRIATKKRCNGDRWARIWEEVPETEATKAHVYDIDNGDMRDIPDED